MDATRSGSEPSKSAGTRAVVLGASMAGLLAARVLSDHFDEVVLLERDALPVAPVPRKGTPHAVHPHGLLARGLQVLEALFPGFTHSMLERGGLAGDMTGDVAFEANRARFAACRAGLQALVISRLAIEAELRARVLARPNVRVITGVAALAPVHSAGRVRAARYRAHDASQAHELPAVLVVDCTGRGSQAPHWLRDWGYAAVAEERVDIGIAYTSGYFKRAGGLALGPGLDRVAVFGAVTNVQPRPGVLLAQEPDAQGTPRWVASVGGFRGDHAAATLEGLRSHARSIGSPELCKVMQEGELLGEVMRYQMSHSQRRRYERLRHLPRGFLVMGDAITSFNPIYGQGMTVAACEALALQRELVRCGREPDAKRFFRAAAKVIATPWQLAVGGDLSIDSVPGHRPAALRVINAYIGRLYRVAPNDPVVSLAFQRVVHLLDEPTALFAPRILWRALRSRRGNDASVEGRAPSLATRQATGTVEH
jgi:2-polyprenyl-6-methoxyphenol hydroxylase-like FAD-dependent oxidoreductase